MFKGYLHMKKHEKDKKYNRNINALNTSILISNSNIIQHCLKGVQIISHDLMTLNIS